MTATVVYQGDLRNIATHVQSGSIVETDAPTDNQGKGERFSPTDLVSVALATCITTTMAIGGKTHNIDIDGTTCEVIKIMAADPRRIAEIKIHLTFPEGKVYSDKEKTVLTRIAETCPVSRSLHPDLKQTLSYTWGGTENA